MSRPETLVIDGIEVRFDRVEDGSLRVLTADREIGILELVPGGAGFVARLASGDAVTKPSRWGGSVTARFGTRELGTRALLSRQRGTDG